MKLVCNYSILRFLPYPETGEFVNIGVVLIANTGELRFKIMSKRQRVTQFFSTLDPTVYLRARREMQLDLARLAACFPGDGANLPLLKNTFLHLVHPRETMMRFSEPGTVMSENIGNTLETLFDHYVNHSFANKEYHEKHLERQLGNLLATFNLRQRYAADRRLGDSTYNVRFPFVLFQAERAVQAIKPLFLGQAEPSKIYEHGDGWLMKVKRLARGNQLPGDTLFLAEPPAGTSAKLLQAYNEVTTELADLEGVRVVNNQAPDREILRSIEHGLPIVH